MARAQASKHGAKSAKSNTERGLIAELDRKVYLLSAWTIPITCARAATA
jgi:hypothetical protein